MVILVSIEVRVNGTEGMMNLCIPCITIEPIIGKLSARYMYSAIRKRKPEDPPNDAAGDLPVATELYYEAGDLTLKAIGQLNKRQLIRLPGRAAGQVMLASGGSRVLELHRESDKAGSLFSVVEEESMPDQG